MFDLPQRLDWLEIRALNEFKKIFDEGEWLESDDDAAADLIAEIADYRTPHLFYQVLEVAQFHPRLAYDVHHLNESYSWISAIEMIQTNIYLHLKEQLSDWYYKTKFFKQKPGGYCYYPFCIVPFKIYWIFWNRLSCPQSSMPFLLAKSLAGLVKLQVAQITPTPWCSVATSTPNNSLTVFTPIVDWVL